MPQNFAPDMGLRGEGFPSLPLGDKTVMVQTGQERTLIQRKGGIEEGGFAGGQGSDLPCLCQQSVEFGGIGGRGSFAQSEGFAAPARLEKVGPEVFSERGQSGSQGTASRFAVAVGPEKRGKFVASEASVGGQGKEGEKRGIFTRRQRHDRPIGTFCAQVAEESKPPHHLI